MCCNCDHDIIYRMNGLAKILKFTGRTVYAVLLKEKKNGSAK